MVTTSNQTTQNTNKKLSIQVSLNGLSFCCKNLNDGTIESFSEISFQSLSKNQTIENHLWQAFLKFTELTKAYDEIQVIHQNNISTFVPEDFFDAKALGSYLQYNVKIFETDFFSYDELEKQQIFNVYAPYININNYLIDQFETFDCFHHATILVKSLLKLSNNDKSIQMFIHLQDHSFDMVVLEDNQLILYNSFEYQTPVDVLYYILFTAEQLQINPEQFPLIFLGKISSESDIFELVFQYIRHVSILDVKEIAQTSLVSEADYIKHFVLFQS